MKVLVTGFDPFGGEEINPAFEVVRAIEDTIAGASIIKLEVPTVFYKSIQLVAHAIEVHKPDIVMAIGQAGGRSEITIERIAINIDDARIPDNEGNQPIDQVIVDNGENAYFSTLPVKSIIRDLKAIGIPSAISETAGTYVCNHLMYGILHQIEAKRLDTLGGFIHIPYLMSQVLDKPKTPCMSLETLKQGIERAIETTVHFAKAKRA